MRLLIATLLIIVSLSSNAEEHKKAILITGASSGLGERMMEVLLENGFFIYATALDKADLPRMNAIDNVQAFAMDVREPTDIAAVANAIQNGGRGLYGLVNNAGVAIFGPMTEVPVEELENIMDVNVFGPYRVLQAFAPMIVQSKGRILTTGSVAGTTTTPLFAHYSMSKHAIDAFTDGLAEELAGTGVSVGVIEPGSFASQIGASAKKRILERNYWREDSLYAEQRKAILARLDQVENGTDPQPVAEAVLDFMTAEKPQRRYLVVPNEAQASATLRKSMQEILQRNQTQQYKYSNEELVNMLQQEMDQLAQ